MSATVSSNIIAKIVILILGLGSLILFTILTSKPEKTNLEKEEVKKVLPMMIAFDVIIVFLILGMVSWNGFFGFEGFTNFHKTLTDFKVFDVSLFNAILGSTLTAFGEWTLYNVIVLLVVTTVILALIYKIKFDGLLESIASGIRRALPYAMIVVLANLVLVGVYNSGFYTTIITSIAGMTDKVLSGTTLSALSSVVYPDYTYATQFTLSTITYTITDTKFYLVLAVIFQVIYSLFLLISPTSILVLLGLQRENVSYKEWIKYIYKYFLGLLIVFFVLIMVVGRNYISALSYVVLAVVIVMLVLFVVLSVTRKDTKKQVKKEKVEVKEEPIKEEIKEKTEEISQVKEITKESSKISNLFTHLLLSLFAIFIIMLISCMFFVTNFSGIGNIQNQDSVSVKAVKLNKDYKYTLIDGKEIFNEPESEYYVLLYKKDGDKSKYYTYINEYAKYDKKFYFVDLNDKKNKFLFEKNDLNFTVNGDRLLKVKDKEYDYFVNGKNNILKEMKNDIDSLSKSQSTKK